VKICDFGVSGIVTNSVANTFVGTQSYMAVNKSFQRGLHTLVANDM